MENQCRALVKEIQNSIDWSMRNLDRDHGQTDVVAQLKETRRRCRKLDAAAGIRPSVGVFGDSQHGKSYLIANMVRAREDTPLKVQLPPDNTPVDFNSKMNPVGNQESTGCVTRFTIHDDCPSGQSGIQLELLTQSELVAVIAHGYLAKVKRGGVPHIDVERFQQQVARLKDEAGMAECDGLTEVDILDLRDFLERSFPSETPIADLRRVGYWEKVAWLAPRLEASERADLFAWLWEGATGITDLYRELVRRLAQLGFPRFAATNADAFIDKLVKTTGQARTILDAYGTRRTAPAAGRGAYCRWHG